MILECTKKGSKWGLSRRIATSIKSVSNICTLLTPRKAKELEISRKKSELVDKTIIIEDSLPYGDDHMETLQVQYMDQHAEAFLVDPDPVLADPPKAPIVALAVRLKDLCFDHKGKQGA